MFASAIPTRRVVKNRCDLFYFCIVVGGACLRTCLVAIKSYSWISLNNSLIQHPPNLVPSKYTELRSHNFQACRMNFLSQISRKISHVNWLLVMTSTQRSLGAPLLRERRVGFKNIIRTKIPQILSMGDPATGAEHQHNDQAHE